VETLAASDRCVIRENMLEFHSKKIIVNGHQWDTKHTVLDAVEFGDIIVVIYDYMEFPKHGVAKNLYGYSHEGHNIWIAENPTTQTNDGYVNFLKGKKGLWVGNFAGYSCQINPKTGRLIEAIFTK
jgi:hypothetical protein